MQEAFKHFSYYNQSSTGMAINARWLGEMDKNGNGLVEPEEFDDELTEENISILIKNCK